MNPTFWLVLAGALGVYVVAELLARAWLRLRDRYYVCLPGLRLEMHLDQRTLPQLGPLVRFEVNSEGERGAEPPAATNDLYRVLVAGGSAAECYLLDQPATWPAVLERSLNEPDALQQLGAARVHVGNIARTSVASRDLDLVLTKVLPRYRRLDALVIMVGASDVLRWLEQGAPPDAPAPALPVSALFARHPQGPFGWLPQRSALFELVKRCRRLLLRPVDVQRQVGKTLAAIRAMRAQAAEVRERVPDPTVMLDNFERCLRASLQTARARARHVLLVRQPWFEKEYTAEEIAQFWDGAAGRPWNEHVRAYYSVELVNRLIGMVDERAARVAQEMAIDQVNVRAMLEPSLRVFYDHWHLTPAGAGEAGRLVAAALLRVSTPSAAARSVLDAPDRKHTARMPVARPGIRTAARESAHPDPV